MGTASRVTDTKSSPQFNTLPEELVIEILQRLPLEDAVQCKCVCKRWFNSISSPCFARCYNRHRFSWPPHFALFFQKTNPGIPRVQLANYEEAHTIFRTSGFHFSFLPPSPSSEPLRFLASSNGLILFSKSIGSFHKLYYVCNPITLHWVALPPPPTENRVSIGFICSPDFDKGMISPFKVVRIYSILWKQFVTLEIFSSDTGEWTNSVIASYKAEFGFPAFSNCTVFCNNAVVCHGMLHWPCVYENHIFALDLVKQDNHEYRTIAFPKESCKEALVRLFGESQARLRYAEFHQGTFRVWKIEDYSSGEWCLIHKFHQSEFVWEDPKIAIFTTTCFHLMHILAFHPIKEDVVFLVLPGHIIECNMRSRSLKSLYSLTNRTADLNLTMFPYVLPWWPIQILDAKGKALGC